MGCGQTSVKNENRMYFTQNNNYMFENRNNNINGFAPLPNNYNQVNENKIFQNFISCPSCGEPLGNNFKSSGTSTETFNCFRCGQYQSYSNYYKCRICNGIFCQKCPQSNYTFFDKCPLCGESAGNKFKASGTCTETFNCFKCGQYQSYTNYYKCSICKGIFCQKCPF